MTSHKLKFLAKGIRKFVNRKYCQKELRNSSMGTGQKMGTSFPKGIKKFVNGYRVNH